MSKLDLASRVPDQYNKATFADIIRSITGQVNPLSEGRLAARHNAHASVPTGTAISHAVGDFVPDSNCTVTTGTIRLGWVCVASGTPGTFQETRVLVASFAPITASLGADVVLNNTGNYFAGPSIAQGTSGTWFVSGNVTVKDTAGAAVFYAKLWDGTTVIDSGAASHPNVGGSITNIALSGYITSPAGDLRISVRDSSSTSGLIVFDDSGNAKDSSITAMRIG